MNLLLRSAGSLLNHALPQAVLMSLTLALSLSAQDVTVGSKYKRGDFKLVYENMVADILVSPDDFKVVRIAAGDFASDIERLTEKKPTVINEMRGGSSNVVIIGTLGKSHFVDGLAKTGRVDVSRIRGKWESFLIATVKDPLPNIKRALVIVGSDRRGTAYGVYEVSQMIGVSPWYWWADVAPEHKTNLIISTGVTYGGEPSVKYRGIFLNDEDWGLQPWAAKTFEPEVGDIGPKTYAKIFELLLRLKANTLWPAMHEVTRPFNSISANRRIADDYAIVMGSSHAEPMLRNNVGEWKANKDDFNFVTNPSGVTAYWEERVKENGRYENIYTLGMRGIHDGPIQGTKNQNERISLLEKILGVQRGLLSKYVRPDVENVPQIFCPYKEVLADYRAGLKVPDDVTIVFPDDNFGYIRQFPTTEEQRRKGGFGVYYHISYLGRPLSYLWLNTTPPALIWEEMSKAYDHNMRQFWVLNVGDLKPGEIGVEFFLQMAWDIRKWRRDNLPDYLRSWAKREFGAAQANEIADVMDEYYRLGFARKPEHLQWYLPGNTPRKSELSEADTLERLSKYGNLRKQAEAINARIATTKKDAFYELVLYPIRSASLANERFFTAELAETYRTQHRSGALFWARRSIAADAEIASETKYFNETLASGKWRFIMSPEMNAGQWLSMRTTIPKISEAEYRENRSEDGFESGIKQWSEPPAKNSGTIKGFVESNGVVSIEAEHFTGKRDKNRVGWQTIPGLGRTGDSVAVFPTTAKSIDTPKLQTNAPVLEYNFNSVTTGEFDANVFLIPTRPIVSGAGLRYAIALDNQPPQIVTVGFDAEGSGARWSQAVLNETVVGTSKFPINSGSHVLKIYMVDTGVILDKIVLSNGSLQPSYLGPPETKIK
jgi:glycosyl hydrolase family 115 (putative glucuronidase)/glycosyl hydrolase family 115